MLKDGNDKNGCEHTCMTRCPTVRLYEQVLDAPIYRYLPLDRYYELVEKKQNTLVHLSHWEDPYEAFIFRAGITFTSERGDTQSIYEIFKDVYGQSWTCNGEESDLLWRAMGKRGTLVRIQSSVRELAKLFCGMSEKSRVQIAKVKYLSDKKFDEMLIRENLQKAVNEEDNSGKMDFFFFKRQAFSQEDEIRVIALPCDEDIDRDSDTNGSILRIKIPSVVDFVKDVLADPCMDRRTFEQLVCRTCHVNSKINVRQSTLFEWPKLQDEIAVGRLESSVLPKGVEFSKWMQRRGFKSGNIRSTFSRVKRVLREFGWHDQAPPTLRKLHEMCDGIESRISNPGSAADCRTAIVHYEQFLREQTKNDEAK